MLRFFPEGDWRQPPLWAGFGRYRSLAICLEMLGRFEEALSAYRDAGSFTIYAGCANEAVGQVIDLVVEELRTVKQTPVPAAELQRAKDHLKGSLMLSLENTASRMSHLARQEIYFDRQFGLDETLQGIESVTIEEVQRVAADLFRNGSLAATVLGNVNGLQIPPERLDLDDLNRPASG